MEGADTKPNRRGSLGPQQPQGPSVSQRWEAEEMTQIFTFLSFTSCSLFGVNYESGVKTVIQCGLELRL